MMSIGCAWINFKNRMIKLLGGHTDREWTDMIYQKERHEDTRVGEYIGALSRMEDLLKQAPKGCTRGPWCTECIFSKKTHFYTEANSPFRRMWSATYCDKDGACKNLVLRGDDGNA